MLFRYSDSRIDFQTADTDGRVDVTYWNNIGKTIGTVRLDASELKELRKWINIQLARIEPKNKQAIGKKIKPNNQ